MASEESYLRTENGSSFVECTYCKKSIPAAEVDAHDCGEPIQKSPKKKKVTTKRKAEPQEKKAPAKKSRTSKRPPSSYQLFCKAKRQDAIQLFETEHNAKPKPSDVLKKLGSMWNELPEDTKNEWKEEAAKIKKELQG